MTRSNKKDRWVVKPIIRSDYFSLGIRICSIRAQINGATVVIHSLADVHLSDRIIVATTETSGVLLQYGNFYKQGKMLIGLKFLVKSDSKSFILCQIDNCTSIDMLRRLCIKNMVFAFK